MVPVRTKIDASLIVRMLAILLAGVAVLTREMEIVVSLKKAVILDDPVSLIAATGCDQGSRSPLGLGRRQYVAEVL